ncbi:unnamed protein product [Cyprideis torosa]|uniref:Uncharacterized protein n=1 Tax=Cyprideis torosa TaxID=163714 RepID=A0A7R8ZMA2_9CRUS|nr:unnamed protein product [Cyprideis torosa]CAG0885367.1 unnamed protein product [Cyprideis torosa]
MVLFYVGSKDKLGPQVMVAHDRGNMVLQLVFPHQESGHTAEARIQGEVDEDSGEWDEDAGNFQDFDKATQKRAPLHVATRSFSQNSLVQRQPQGSGGGSSGVVVSRGDSGIGGDAPTGSAGSGGFKSPLAQNDTLSLRSYGNTQPSASSEREKWDNFTDTLTIVLSCIYALFLLMLGSVIYIADSALPEVNIAEVFSFCQFWPTVAADVMHVEAGNSPTASENASTKPIQKAEQLDFNPAKAYSITNKGYWFLSGRHGGNIYLKIGTAGFCLGHMIHEGLLLGRQLIYFTTSDEEIYNECADTATLMLDIIHPLFIFYSLFIVFKYHSVVIERHRGLARFGLMHCIASSLCFWFWTILRETIDSIQHYYYKKYSGSGGSDYGTTTTGTEDSTYSDEDDSGDVMSLGLSPPTSGAYTGSSTGGSAKLDDPLGGFLNDTLLGTYTKVCIGGAQVTGLIAEVAPYLYPFSIEFNILVAGVWFLMYRNIGMKHESELEVESDQRNEYIPVGTSEKKHKDEHIVIIDCHSANRGLFAGMLCLVLTVVSVIIFFLAFSDEDYKDVGYYVNMASELTLSVLMIISSTVAYKQITKLDVVRHSHAELDTLLLFIAVPCFFLYAIFTTVPSIHYGSVTYIVAVFCQVIQVIIQTPMIIEGLKRCSNSQRLREKKPGKELISFLIIANIAMWIIETFEIKSAEAHKERTEYYGKIVWTLLSHMTLPLCLFYRFHSSVCLVDIWKNAYEPEE